MTTGKALGYVLLPGILPRVGRLLFSGFGPIPYFLAVLCLRMRLLPRGHRFFHTRAPYGVRHVLAEAARNLDFKWKNIDQIIVYVALLCGAASLFAFLLAVILYVATSSAAHAAIWVVDLFVTAQPEHDVAFMMLDRVFGIPGIFDSGIITDTATYGPAPNVFQLGLQSLFGFFSWGLFSIAIFIFLYFLVEMVLEITQTGKALDAISGGADRDVGFGWIPLRMVLAFGLLVPLGNGLNSAQYITLYTAKFGSGLATNAWGAFNETTGTNPLGVDNEELIGVLGYQDLSNLLKGMMMMKACDQMNEAGAYAASTIGVSGIENGANGFYDVRPYIVNGSQGKPLFTTPKGITGVLDSLGNKYTVTPKGAVTGDPGDAFAQVLSQSESGGIRVVMGYQDPDDPSKFNKYPGGVLPVCGEVYIPVTGYNPEALLAAEAYFYATMYTLVNLGRNGNDLSVQERNTDFAVVREYTRTSPDYLGYINWLQDSVYNQKDRCGIYDNNGDGYLSYDEGQDDGKQMGKCTEPVPAKFWSDYLGYASTLFLYDPYAAGYGFLTDQSQPTDAYSIGDTRYSNLGYPNPLMLDIAMTQLGWGGAGMWFNRIAEKNGSFVGAVGGIPVIQKMPMAMESLKEQKGMNDTKLGSGFCQQYAPGKSGATSINVSDEKAQFTAELAHNLHRTCRNLFENEHIQIEVRDSGGDLVFRPNDQKYPNPVEHAMAAVFSEFKMFDVRSNDNVLPMAQLTAVGRVLVDKSIMAMTAAMGSSAMGSLLHMAAASSDGKDVAALNDLGAAFGEASGAALTFATLGLTAGVMLHYVLPFLPFVYFFFAVGRWVKTIFEAMVGVPLWALAHMRLNGEGLPGEAASSGYFLLLEIFIRPIITVFSLLASFATFTALALVLNAVFDLLVTNFGGADVPFASADQTILDNARGIADQFFYSIMYVVLSYMIAASSFKLIDIIPDNILSRWSGAGVHSFGASDNADDLIDQLRYQLPVAVHEITEELGHGVKDAIYQPGKQIGQAAEAKQAAEMAKQQAAQKAGASKKNPADDGGNAGGGAG